MHTSGRTGSTTTRSLTLLLTAVLAPAALTTATALPAAAAEPTGTAGASTTAGTTTTATASRTLTLAPTADATARQATPSTPSGAATTLLSDSQETSGLASRATTYLRFTIPTLAAGETITAAALSLHVTNGSTNGPAIWRTSPAWTESTLTWTSGQPARSGTTALGNYASTATGRTSTPLTGITSSGELSLQLHADSSDGIVTSSREHPTTTDRPRLVLTVTRG